MNQHIIHGTDNCLALIPSNVQSQLQQYKLIWDTGNGFIATFCKSRRTANHVRQILNSHNIPAHQLRNEDKIVVIYL